MPNRLITINKVITLNEKVQKIVSIDYLRWETKNDLIFCENVSEEIYGCLKELNTTLDNYYKLEQNEENIKSFSKALKEKAKDLEQLLITILDSETKNKAS